MAAPRVIASLLRIAVMLAVGYAALLVVVYFMRERLTFPVRGGGLGEPRAAGMPDGERVLIAVEGAVLAAWWLPPAPGTELPAPAMIWFHGNGETVRGLAPVLRQFRLPGVALLAVDPRGYGESSGSPTAENSAADAVRVFDWLAARDGVAAGKIVVYGRSVGSGPAARVAAVRDVAGLVLESPFTSLRGMARVHYPYFPSRLASGAFDNLGAVRASRAPVLIIHGTADGIVPPWMPRALAVAAGARAQLWAIEGADHNETYDVGDEEYVRRVAEFVKSLPDPPQRRGQ